MKKATGGRGALKEVSLFEEALKIARTAQAEDLGTVPIISRRDFEERPTFLFRAKVPCLEYVSLMIETALLLRTNRMGRVYVGFEKLSRMEPVAGRYLRIADISERVYVFGEADWKPPRHPNIKVIKIPGDITLAREWFVIADSSTLRVALVGMDEDGFGLPVLEERNFQAFKSSDPAVVTRLAAMADGLIDSSQAV
jgi:Sensory domain in DIguanylate Cyclases and Two-component system